MCYSCDSTKKNDRDCVSNDGPSNEAHECAVSWETAPRAWLANMIFIEMYNGLRPVPGLR